MVKLKNALNLEHFQMLPHFFPLYQICPKLHIMPYALPKHKLLGNLGNFMNLVLHV